MARLGVTQTLPRRSPPYENTVTRSRFLNHVEGAPQGDGRTKFIESCVPLPPLSCSQKWLSVGTSSKMSRHNFHAERTAIRSFIFFQSISYSLEEKRAGREELVEREQEKEEEVREEEEEEEVQRCGDPCRSATPGNEPRGAQTPARLTPSPPRYTLLSLPRTHVPATRAPVRHPASQRPNM